MEKELKRRIAELSRLMAEAQNLDEVDTYFHEQVVRHPAFMSAGVRALHKPLRDVVRNVARAYGHVLTGCSLFHLGEFSLWHGSLGSPLGPMATVVYFDDRHLGVACFASLSDGHAHHMRFSLPEGARDPSVELGEMEIVGVSRRTQPGLA